MTTLQRAVLTVAILASLVAFLDGSVVNVALPAIERELGGGLVLQQWVVDAYLITLGALILLAGSLSDAFGRKRILMIGLFGFGIASIACAVAPDGVSLVVFRAIQGIAGALLVPSSLAIIIQVFSEDDQPKAIGRWTAWTSAAMLVGPLLGGLFVDTLSWRLVFAINPIPIAVTIVILWRIQLDHEHAHGHIDYLGAVLGAVGLGGVVFALIEQGQVGWGDPLVWGVGAIGCLCLVAFVVVEMRTKQPMLPFALFRIRNFGVGNVATLAIYAALSLGTLIVGIYLQEVAGYKATLAGLALVPATVVSLLLSGRFGALSGKWGPRLFMAVGPLVAAGGYALLLTMGTDVNYWLEVLPGMLVFGLGLSITVAPLTAAILGAVPPEHAGIGSAINNAVARIAGLVAVACAGLIVAGPLDQGGMRRVLAVCVVLLVLGGVVSAIGITNKRRRPQAATQAAIPTAQGPLPPTR
ncbi:DHA2 family efflux MFS transporter permease subunit [Planctomonas sp. JC2975]|uniref:DHA2 family efflux MFS transporter permease subunit n=1 Tax=Planctomonas sp. JC2975 TaxID=2729626 RepID=UPI003211D995